MNRLSHIFHREHRSRQRRHLAGLLAIASALSGLAVLGAAGPAYPTTTVVTLTSVAVGGVPAPIGIDYYEPTNSIVTSVNYGSGSPNNFDQIDSAGNVSQFSNVAGVGGEIYMATIRTSACEGGFTPGDMYFPDGSPGGIAKLSGGVLTDPWTTLPNEGGGIDGGLFQDVYCVAGGDLIATTDSGDVWRVTSAGDPTLVVAGYGVFLEGPTTVPNDPRYGPWAGQILAADEAGSGYILSIDPTTGATATWDGGGNWGYAEGVHIVPPNENFFATDYGNNAVLGAPASQFTGVVGDVVLATELPGKLLDITWDNSTSSFQSYDMLSSDAGQFEGTAFAPAGLPGVPSTVGEPTTLTVHSGSGDYNDSTSVSATLTDTATSNPVSGESVSLTLNGAETCTGTTNASGMASCTITPGEAAGPYTLGASFAGDSSYQGSTGSAAFSVTHEQTGLSYTGDTSAVNGQSMTLSGVLTTDDPAAGTALAGESVSFTLGSGGSAQTCSGTTDPGGAASCTIVSVNQTAGSVGVSDAFAGDSYHSSASGGGSATVSSAAHATSLTVHAGSSDFADSTSVSATLTDTVTSNAVSGESVALTLNSSETCSGTTNASGVASCTITPGEAAGPYTLAGSFTGDSAYQGSTGSASFTVNLEQTGLTYTGDTSAINGQPMTLSGVLTTDDPASGTTLGTKSVTFTLGSGGSAQTCSGTTGASGVASCVITSVNQTPGSVNVSDAFAGTTRYNSASASSSATIFARSALGAFVVGDRSAGAPTNGNTVEFWGSQWSSVNSLSGGTASTSMKGYAASPTGITCGGHWTTSTGSSSLPPATLPGTIEVIVSSKVTKSGSTLSGDIKHIVMVQVKAGYSNASGHTGSGTIVGTVC